LNNFPPIAAIPACCAAASAALGGWRRAVVLLWVLAAGLVGLPPLPGQAADMPVLTGFEVGQDEEGVSLSYSLNFELSKSVEDALNKGVPLYFLAEAEVYRERWYWRDKRVAHATRLWRIAYQPLTTSYRVTFGGLNLSYNSQAEALAAMRRTVRWKVAETGQVDGGKHYVEFSFRLDTTLLPRPMQIGISGQPDWSLSVERMQRFN
jgi:Domain of unknown function (DUF4390)